MTIFHVKSNLNHSGTRYATGDVFEGVLGEFQGLVTGGTLEVIEAESLAEAREVVAEQKRVAEAKVAAEESGEEGNTWGPKSDETAAAAEDKNVDGEEDNENESEDDLETLTKDKLLKVVKKEKVEGVSESNTKAELVEAIRAARAPASEEDEGAEDDL